MINFACGLAHSLLDKHRADRCWFIYPSSRYGISAVRAREGNEGRSEAPFIELIRTYPKQIVLAIGTRFATDITFNVINVFMLAYGTQQLGLPRDLFLKAILIGCAVALITLPLFGKLSDVVGRRTVYMFGAVFVIIYGFVFFRLIETKEPNFIVLAYIGGIAFSQASTYAVQSTWFAEIFGTRVRYTGTSCRIRSRVSSPLVRRR